MGYDTEVVFKIHVLSSEFYKTKLFETFFSMIWRWYSLDYVAPLKYENKWNNSWLSLATCDHYFKLEYVKDLLFLCNFELRGRGEDYEDYFDYWELEIKSKPAFSFMVMQFHNIPDVKSIIEVKKYTKELLELISQDKYQMLATEVINGISDKKYLMELLKSSCSYSVRRKSFHRLNELGFDVKEQINDLQLLSSGKEISKMTHAQLENILLNDCDTMTRLEALNYFDEIRPEILFKLFEQNNYWLVPLYKKLFPHLQNCDDKMLYRLYRLFSIKELQYEIISKIFNQDLLLDIAINDPDNAAFAIRRMDNPKYLTRFAIQTYSYWDTREALEKLDGGEYWTNKVLPNTEYIGYKPDEGITHRREKFFIRIANQAVYNFARTEAIIRIHNQGFLKSLFDQNHRSDEELRAAINNITDPKFVKKQMAIKRLEGSKYQNEYLNRHRKMEIEDMGEKQLKELVFSDASSLEKLWAFNSIDNPEEDFLEAVLAQSTDLNVLESALSRVNSPNILADFVKRDIDNELSVNAINMIHDQNLLFELATNKQTKKYCRQYTILISSPQLLMEIYEQVEDKNCREHIIFSFVGDKHALTTLRKITKHKELLEHIDALLGFLK